MTSSRLPHTTCRSLLAGRLICADTTLPRQVIQYKGPCLVHEPFVNEIHSTVFYSRVVLLSTLPPCRLLRRAAELTSPDCVAATLADYLLPADKLDTGLLVSLEPTPTLITISQA
ncbi:MAG: hypothetical protein HDR82_06080 [Bacteroides sp.]|nr:hypothetical protein [Bacteroides sp.]